VHLYQPSEVVAVAEVLLQKDVVELEVVVMVVVEEEVLQEMRDQLELETLAVEVVEVKDHLLVVLVVQELLPLKN
jgi:hypothetical protein